MPAGHIRSRTRDSVGSLPTEQELGALAQFGSVLMTADYECLPSALTIRIRALRSNGEDGVFAVSREWSSTPRVPHIGQTLTCD